jgi:hypothetical protein
MKPSQQQSFLFSTREWILTTATPGYQQSLVCSLEQKVARRSFLWAHFYGAFKTTGNSLKKTRLNHDDSDLQAGALEKRPEFPTWNSELDDCSNVFSQSELVFFRVPSCLELTEVWVFPVPSFELFWMRQKSYWIESMANVFNLFRPIVLHVNVYPFKLRK